MEYLKKFIIYFKYKGKVKIIAKIIKSKNYYNKSIYYKLKIK